MENAALRKCGMYGESIMNEQEKIDREWMRLALELAGRGAGHVSPNPMVGAVIVKDGKLIGEGWHEYCGGLHAERNALADCRKKRNDPQGATIYVTLEPCCHYGKTPPCTEAIMENGLSRVVFGAWDPNPLVAGKGIDILKKAGIETEGPVMEEECREKNKIFFHYITSGMPYVIMKYAMTSDGKIACETGDSRWVTGEMARRRVHKTRRAVSGIMAGIGTVLSDDPMLNCRLEQDPVDPVRIICDSGLRIPEDSQIVRTAGKIRTIVAYVPERAAEYAADPKAAEKAADGMIPEKKAERLAECGVGAASVSAGEDGRVDLRELMRLLGERKIDSILLEGGSEPQFFRSESGDRHRRAGISGSLNSSAAAGAKTPVGGAGIARMADAVQLSSPKMTFLGQDILLEYDVLPQDTERKGS